MKFAFSWHTEKFFLACLVLLGVLLFLISFIGSVGIGSIIYLITIAFVGIADYLKMKYRQEPLYPDDLKMVTEFGTLKDIAGTGLFIVLLAGLAACVGLMGYGIWKSRKLSKPAQMIRLAILLGSVLFLSYVNHFNDPANLLRKAYNKTALWIPYSQKMNYYNTGFIGGFLYNLNVEPMEKPENYSKAAVEAVTKKYHGTKDTHKEKPNIIYIMNESFSDPYRLKTLLLKNGDPLAAYRKIAETTYSGQMLSQNYGGGTANIEFEALTSFSMEPFEPQLTTPYTQLVPKMEKIPSVVSYLKEQNYYATAIHPYNTSMYKRKDVYDLMGFDQFLSEKTMKYQDKIAENPYITDASAYKEILDVLDNQKANFVHLVTMQTHMPYNTKYPDTEYSVSGENAASIEGFAQDIQYASEALAEFVAKVDQLDRRTLIVFWGDHLPGIYSDRLQAANEKTTLHETEFFIYDNQHQITADQENVISPIYFSDDLLELSGEGKSGFYQLVDKLQAVLPAFEKGMYYQDGQWLQEAKLNSKEEELYDDYRLIQYDVLAGKQYSMKGNFFKHE